MKNRDGPLPALVGSTVVAAVLCTVLVQGGWLIWIPTLVTLVVIGTFKHRMSGR